MASDSGTAIVVINKLTLFVRLPERVLLLHHRVSWTLVYKLII